MDEDAIWPILGEYVLKLFMIGILLIDNLIFSKSMTLYLKGSPTKPYILFLPSFALCLWKTENVLFDFELIF